MAIQIIAHHKSPFRRRTGKSAWYERRALTRLRRAIREDAKYAFRYVKDVDRLNEIHLAISGICERHLRARRKVGK